LSSSSTVLLSSSSSPGTTDWEVSYSLPEPFDCEELESSNSIIFNAELNNKTKTYRIKGFTITVTAENVDEMLEKANTQAERLIQIMTVKSLGYVNYTYEGYNSKMSGAKTVIKKIGFPFHTRQMIDELNLNKNRAISFILENDEDTNIQLYHTRLAIGAEESRRFADMYRELFQVIEKEIRLPDYCKYKSLRDAISHQTKLDRAMAEVEKHFGKGRYDFTSNQEFNHNSKKNRENLRKDADDLKKIVISYLSPKLK
jgi:hypothetical protein